jgi:hypothetical protein
LMRMFMMLLVCFFFRSARIVPLVLQGEGNSNATSR